MWNITYLLNITHGIYLSQTLNRKKNILKNLVYINGEKFIPNSSG